jgi:hypothetical protein
MKIQLLLFIMDVLILVAYPIVFIIHRIRRMMGAK